MRDRSCFDTVDHAMEEAEWSADTFGAPYAVIMEGSGFAVIAKSDLEKEDLVFEIFNKVASAVRCGNCGYADEGAKVSSFATSTWGIQGPGQEARGDHL